MNPILQKDMEDIFSRNNSWERLEKSTVLLTGAYGMLASYICLLYTSYALPRIREISRTVYNYLN